METVRVIFGQSCTVRGVDSEVLLEVPSGIYGVILAKVHTDHSKFLHHIPHEDCVVSPICEYLLRPFIGYNAELPEGSSYVIKIPHILNNVQEVRKHLKIRHGEIHKRHPLIEETFYPSGKSPRKSSFDIDDKYVILKSTHFSGYIVTAKSVNCCSDSAKIIVFGSLNKREETYSADLKVYSSKRHYDIDDYLKVHF